jgi:hypothetical protein
MLYPNPANGEFTIVYNNTNKLASLTILSLDGRIVLSEKFSANPKAINRYHVNKLQKGVYLVKLSDGDKFISRKLVVK